MCNRRARSRRNTQGRNTLRLNRPCCWNLRFRKNNARHGVPGEGANAGEACAHFTATEPSVKLLENIRQFGFFDMKMVDTGLINVFDMDVLYSWLGLEKSTFDLEDVHSLIKSIVDIVNTIGVTRLVIDSVTTLCYKIKSEQLIRDFLFTLGKKASNIGLHNYIDCRNHFGNRKRSLVIFWRRGSDL